MLSSSKKCAHWLLPLAAALSAALLLPLSEAGADASTPITSTSRTPATVTTQPLVVVRGTSALKWVALLRSTGASARLGSFAEGLARGRLLLPAGSAISVHNSERLRRGVLSGDKVLVVDPALLRALGFRNSASVPLNSVTMPGLPGIVNWPSSYNIPPLHSSPALKGFTALAASGRDVVAARALLGRGTVVALAIDPFQYGLQGHELLPLLPAEAATALGTQPGPQRDSGEIYFDPGSSSLSPEEVAARLASFRTVYIAGWNYGYLSQSFDYPYQRLIDALHARGVRAYAWLEPPEVNLTLWVQHPECRERTQDGQDAFVDWRRLIALEDKSCFSRAWSVWSGLLSSFDWDGVNVAELYFEDGAANRMTPFHPSALAAFAQDPLANPNDFLDWRTQEVTALNDKLVSRIRSLKPTLDVEMTVIDDELDPKLGRAVGSSVKALSAVAREQGAALQIEDPFTTWTQGPRRYAVLAPKVAPLMPPRRAFFDINIVSREYAHPTVQMTGAELSLSVMYAAQNSGRVALYSASTLTDADLAAVAPALAGAATTGDGFVTAPWSVSVSSPRAGYGRLLLDGHSWPAASGQAIIPSGHHLLAWAAGEDGYPALVRLAGELSAEASTPSSLTVSYSASATAWALVSKLPSSLSVDGAPAALDVRTDPGQGYSVRLPAGDHQVALGF